MEQQTQLLQELVIEMKSIKSMLGGNSVTTPKERYISPKEIMERLGIGRSKLDEWANTRFIQKIKPDPNTKKVYFLHSDLNQKFPNVFPLSV
jgi:hypothetical protein